MNHELNQARVWTRKSLPATKPDKFLANRDILVTDDGKNWIWANGWQESAVPFAPASGGGTGTPGQNGKDATVNIGTVTSTTLPAGSQATAQVTDSNPDPNVATLNFNFGIPQGVKGDTGATGSGGTGTSTLPFIVLQPTGGDDTQLWRDAIAQAKLTSKAIHPFGTFKISGELTVDLDHFNFAIVGNRNARIQVTTTNPITVIKRRTPVNNAEALNTGTFAKWDITGLTIEGKNNQIGIDCGPQYNANISNNYFDGLRRGVHAKFALFSKFKDNMYINCIDGIIVDIGDWTDATNFNSQSNSCEVSGRYYGNSATATTGKVATGGTPFGFFGVSGGWLHDFIVEGVSAGTAVHFDGLGSTVVKDFTIERGHIECTQGFSVAALSLRILGGTITIDKMFGQYAALFMKAESQTGLGNIVVKNVPFWLPKNGKHFNTTNISMHFDRNEAFRGISSAMWEGTPPSPCMPIGTTGCGYHRYTWTDVGR
jgi:hypothetical protein